MSEEQDFDKTFPQALMLEQPDKKTGLFVSPANVHSVNKIHFKKSNSIVKNGVQTKNYFNKAKSYVGQVFKNVFGVRILLIKPMSVLIKSLNGIHAEK